MTKKGTYCYDLEVSPNFFSAVFTPADSDEPSVFVIHEARDDRDALMGFMKSVRGLIGFNSIFYDSALLRFLIGGYYDGIFAPAWTGPTEVTHELYAISQRLISENSMNDEVVKGLRFPPTSDWKDLDLMKMMAFDKLGLPLKQVAVNLRWHRIQDLPFEYDQEIDADDIDMVLDYNLNDVRITRELYQRLHPEIDLRREIGKVYQVDVTSASNSKIANLILEKLMARDRDHLNQLRGLRTDRFSVKLAECIPPGLNFQSPELCALVSQLAATTVVKPRGFHYKLNLRYAAKDYQLGIGGLHSEDSADDFRSDDQFIIRDADVASYYPSIMLNLGIRPEHLDQDFSRVLRQMTDDRIRAKHEGDMTKAAALKITINSIFGKLGFEFYWLYDPRAFLSVTIAGQLYLLKLIEMLTISGVEVISANTDGVTCKIRRGREQDYLDTCREWQEQTHFELEFTDYVRYVRRDVNNYIAIKPNGKTKEKGVFASAADLTKGYKMPVVQKCLYELFVNHQSIDSTLAACRDIYDYAISEKTGKQFVLEYHSPDGSVQPLQRNNRFIVSRSGGALIKRHRTTSATSRLMAGESCRLLNDVDASAAFEDYDVNMDFYRREAEKIAFAVQPPVMQMALFG